MNIRHPSALVALILLAGVACEEDPGETTCAPTCAYGRIEGRVSDGLGGLVSELALRRISTDMPGTAYITTISDSSGWFRLIAPEGSYILCATLEGSRTRDYYTSQDLIASYRDADTLLMADAVSLKTDFDYGAIQLQLSMPVAAEWRDVGLYFYPIEQLSSPRRRYRSMGRATVRNGQASICARGLLPGSYAAELNLGRGHEYWLPLTGDPLQADTLTVNAGRATQYATAILENPALLQGQIRGSWQAMHTNNPQVTLFDLDSTRIASTSVDADGAFEIEVWMPTRVRVCVKIGYVKRWAGGDSFAAATEFLLEPGAAPVQLDYVESGLMLDLRGPGLFWGHEALVDLVDSAGVIVASGSVFTGSVYGQVLVPNLAPGTHYAFIFQVQPMEQPWAWQWYDRSLGREAATPIEILGGGEVTYIRVELEVGGGIRGALPGSSGWLWEYCTIFITRSDEPRCVGYVHPDADGTFAARGLPDGDYRVALHGHGYWGWGIPVELPAELLWYPGTTDWDSAAVITVLDQSIVTGIDFTIPD